jgi:nucleotide-binding universal stress UspA family protein
MGFELGRDGPTAIVVGVDGSETSLRAAAYAAGLARRQSSKLFIVYARKQPAALVSFGDQSGIAVCNVLQAQDEVERMLRDGLRTQAKVLQIDAHLVVRDGDPLSVLSEVAKEVRADAVIVGASTSMGHRITGSLALRLVRTARWPVTVVP